MGTKGNWSQHIRPDLLPLLIRGGTLQPRFWPLLTLIAGILASLALAGPSWEKRPSPAAENRMPLVVMLDLSPSMLVSDLTPNRLTRARLKLIDLLRLRLDGQTALIAYAGTAHRVVPLTDDSRTIENLLPALHPSVMPVAGSRPEDAVRLALEMLEDAGSASRGHLLLITDEVVPDAQKEIRDLLPVGVGLSVLGIGTVEGAPIPIGGGNFQRDQRDQILMPRLNRNELQVLAGLSGGRYIELQPDTSDVEYLLEHFDSDALTDGSELAESRFDLWHDAGYWLILPLMLLALNLFRRGLLAAIAPFAMTPFAAAVLLLSLPPPAQALDWEGLWRTPDQQAMQRLEAGDAQAATQLFENPDWRGHAAFAAGDYAAAVESFAAIGAQGRYNQASNLALSGDLEGALALLEELLTEQPDHEAARHNQNLIQQLLEQQEQEQQEQQQQEQQEGESDESESAEDGETSDEPSQEEQSQEQQNEEQQGEEQPNEEQSAEDAAAEENQAEEDTAGNESETGEPEQVIEIMPEDGELSPEAEQWLRSIPDDPAGLLRRKFEYESQLYRQQQRFLPPTAGRAGAERY